LSFTLAKPTYRVVVIDGEGDNHPTSGTDHSAFISFQIGSVDY